MKQLKREEIRLLRLLRSDARMSVAHLARLTGLPTSTVHDKLKKLMRLVSGKTCLLDFMRLGYPIKAFYLIKEGDRILPLIESHPSTNTLIEITSGYDLMAEMIFKDFREMSDFEEMLEGQETLSFHAVRTIHQERFYSGEDDED